MSHSADSTAKCQCYRARWSWRPSQPSGGGTPDPFGKRTDPAWRVRDRVVGSAGKGWRQEAIFTICILASSLTMWTRFLGALGLCAAARGYIPAVNVPNSDVVNTQDNSTIRLTWQSSPMGTFQEGVSYQLAGRGSMGINKVCPYRALSSYQTLTLTLR